MFHLSHALFPTGWMTNLGAGQSTQSGRRAITNRSFRAACGDGCNGHVSLSFAPCQRSVTLLGGYTTARIKWKNMIAPTILFTGFAAWIWLAPKLLGTPQTTAHAHQAERCSLWLQECTHGSGDDPIPSRTRERLCALWSTRECEQFLAERYEKDSSDGTQERVEKALTHERMVEMNGDNGAVSDGGSTSVNFFFWIVISLIFYGIWEAIGAGVLSVVRYVGGQGFSGDLAKNLTLIYDWSSPHGNSSIVSCAAARTSMCLTSPTTFSTSSFLGYSSDSGYRKSGLDSPALSSLDSALKEADGAYGSDSCEVMSRARCFNFAMGFEEEREDESWVPKECCRADEPDSSLRRWRVDDILEPSSERNPGDRLIGTGAFGRVRLRRLENGMEVAVKGISRELDDKMKDLQINLEISLLKETSVHPHIVDYLGHVKTSDMVYVIMPAARVDLSRMITGRGLDELQARFCARQLLCAVEYLHGKNITHRDVKPENVLIADVAGKFRVQLADFGLAARNSLGDDTFRGVCGTEGYRAPEMISNLRYTVKVDTWAVGVVVFMMLEGRHPFRTGNQRARGAVHIKQERKRVLQGRFRLDAKWAGGPAEDFLKKVLEVNPEKRLSSAQAFEHEWLGGATVAEGMRVLVGAVIHEREEQRAMEIEKRVECLMRREIGVSVTGSREVALL